VDFGAAAGEVGLDEVERTLCPGSIAPSLRPYNLGFLLHLAESRDRAYRGAVLRSWQLAISVLDVNSRGEDEDLPGL